MSTGSAAHIHAHAVCCQLLSASTSQHSWLICNTMAHLSPPSPYYLHRNKVWGSVGEEGGLLNIFFNKHLDRFSKLFLSFSVYLYSSLSWCRTEESSVFFSHVRLLPRGWVHVTTVTDIKVIIIARELLLVKGGRRDFLRSRSGIGGQGVNS